MRRKRIGRGRIAAVARFAPHIGAAVRRRFPFAQMVRVGTAAVCEMTIRAKAFLQLRRGAGGQEHAERGSYDEPSHVSPPTAMIRNGCAASGWRNICVEIRPMAVNRRMVAAALLAVAAACSPAPTAPTDPNTLVTPGNFTGPVRLAFITANIPPGSTIAGCGPLIEGCAGRLRITLQLEPPSDGPVLYARVYLHSIRNNVACLYGETPPFTVRGGQRSAVDIVLTTADRCGTPETIATMSAVVERPVQIASRQEWAIRYVFAP
jgi:hypothetical protein